MKILLYGDAPPGSGAWCYADTLRAKGHTVSQFDDSTHLQQYHTSFALRIYRKLFKRILERDRREHVRSLVDTVERFQPEIVVILKGLHVALADLSRLKRDGRWVCNINHDDFFSLNPNNRSTVQRQSIPGYDWIFATREVNLAEILPLNPNVSFLQFAYYPKIHRIVTIPDVEVDRWNADVVFAGTFAKERSRLLEQLASRVPARYAVYGKQWEKLSPDSPLRRWVHHEELHFDDLAKALGGAKVALGFLRKENRDDYTQRTFEIPACGGCFLAERTNRHKSFYREGEEAAFFDADSSDELCMQVRALLANHAKRENIKLQGRAALLRQGAHIWRPRRATIRNLRGACQGQHARPPPFENFTDPHQGVKEITLNPFE